ncbi:MAG: hypothetical protein II179_02120, partial [Alphaproteobacteria bacterium]|nr:hypothetical protein [Alphaproteobacteria bacterium]
MKQRFVVTSLIAMLLVVPAIAVDDVVERESGLANKTVTSKAYVDHEIAELSSHKVNGQALSNAQITLYGEETEDSGATRKQVALYDYSDPNNPTLVQMDALVPGMVIVVKPRATFTGTSSFYIVIANVNGDRGARAMYHGEEIPSSMLSKLWSQNVLTAFVYDGTYWEYVAGGEDSGIESLYWNVNYMPTAITGYSTTFDNTTGNWRTRDEGSFVQGGTFANALALKLNKGSVLDTEHLDMVSSEFVDLVNNTGGYYTNELYLLPGAVSGSNWAYEAMNALKNYVPTVDAMATALNGLYNVLHFELTPLTWGSSETTSTNAYDTTFVGDTGATANAWPAADKTKLINTAALAQGLSLKQNKIGATWIEFQELNGVDGDILQMRGLVTSNDAANDVIGTQIGLMTNDDVIFGLGLDAAGGSLLNANYSFFTANNLGGRYDELESFVPTVAAVGEALRELQYSLGAFSWDSTKHPAAIEAYSTTFSDSTTGAWPAANETKAPSGGVLANALSLKQNKIGATSDGTNSTPNYVYNATTNPAADGSVVTTTGTSGTVSQRGIATAPTYDANDNLTNGSWLPTMSAVE